MALSLSMESSGLSTGVWLVNLESNWLASSADCCQNKWVSESPGKYCPRGSCCVQEVHLKNYQERFKWRLDFVSKEVIPVYVPEEWVGLENRTVVWWQLNDNLKITDGVTGNRLVTLAFIKVSTWTSAASPGPAPSRSEAFLFSSFQKYRKKIWSITLNYYFSLMVHSGWFRLPFSEGPWLLVWGMEGGWVCISGFCQWSSCGFPRWMEATIK